MKVYSTGSSKTVLSHSSLLQPLRLLRLCVRRCIRWESHHLKVLIQVSEESTFTFHRVTVSHPLQKSRSSTTSVTVMSAAPRRRSRNQYAPRQGVWYQRSQTTNVKKRRPQRSLMAERYWLARSRQILELPVS